MCFKLGYVCIGLGLLVYAWPSVIKDYYIFKKTSSSYNGQHYNHICQNLIQKVLLEPSGIFQVPVYKTQVTKFLSQGSQTQMT